MINCLAKYMIKMSVSQSTYLGYRTIDARFLIGRVKIRNGKMSSKIRDKMSVFLP